MTDESITGQITREALEESFRLLPEAEWQRMNNERELLLARTADYIRGVYARYMNVGPASLFPVQVCGFDPQQVRDIEKRSLFDNHGYYR